MKIFKLVPLIFVIYCSSVEYINPKNELIGYWHVTRAEIKTCPKCCSFSDTAPRIPDTIRNTKTYNITEDSIWICSRQIHSDSCAPLPTSWIICSGKYWNIENDTIYAYSRSVDSIGNPIIFKYYVERYSGDKMIFSTSESADTCSK